MFRGIIDRVKAARDYWQLSEAAKEAMRLDLRGLPDLDPGIDSAVESGIAWLCAAQDHSASHDGGVARDYSLITGWATSYPETTGYIIPTFLTLARAHPDLDCRVRAERMLDWLVSIQYPEGGFQGGRVDAHPRLPVTFNTGQILLGLAAGVAEFGDVYREPMIRAANWLVATQDHDGCWRKFPTPFAKPGEKTYETHVAWGLLEAARVVPDSGYGEAALSNVKWALTQQRENGWLEQCCLSDPEQPLTHTIGYALRGIVEAYRFSGDDRFLSAALRTADALLDVQSREDCLPGRLRADWSAAVEWVCLTGSVQIAHSWLLLHQLTGEIRYLTAGLLANQFVRRSITTEGAPETRGGVKGSFPVQGDYGRFQYLNWACKFSIDSNLLEREIRLARNAVS